MSDKVRRVEKVVTFEQSAEAMAVIFESIMDTGSDESMELEPIEITRNDDGTIATVVCRVVRRTVPSQSGEIVDEEKVLVTA